MSFSITFLLSRISNNLFTYYPFRLHASLFYILVILSISYFWHYNMGLPYCIINLNQTTFKNNSYVVFIFFYFIQKINTSGAGSFGNTTIFWMYWNLIFESILVSKTGLWMFWLSKYEDQISTVKIEDKVIKGRDWRPK